MKALQREKPRGSFRGLAEMVLSALCLAALFLAAACPRRPGTGPEAHSSARIQENKMMPQETIVLAVGDASFTVALADTEAARELAGRLPLRLDMAELNGNEKYASLDRPFAAKAEKVRRIEAGDMMLWGNDCLVIFYQSFDTPYTYTRLGRIHNANGLANAVGKGNVSVTLLPSPASP